MTHNKATETTASPLLLLEIGTEEIPARFYPSTMERLREIAESMFADYRIPVASIKTFATPRRLTLIAEIAASQEAAEKEVWGPPVTAAFDKEGNPTKAAEAFAKTHGLSLTALERREKGKGTYLVAVVKEKAEPTEELLPELLPRLIASLSFPKAMRWGDGTFRFARPIHWILATCNNKKISFDIDGVKSSNSTRGHRFLAPAAFEIKDSKTYVSQLRNSFVVIDPEERKKIIAEGIAKLAASAAAVPVEDEELLQHVSFLVEYPMPVLGDFPAEYLSLPKELLITVMKGHQKYFALEGKEKKGQLTNHFIIVSNTKQGNAVMVKKGAERVIKARFEDARFYFDEDRKVKLADRVEELKKVVYHDKLGTLFDKTMRVAALADFIADRCCPDKKEHSHTAALLSKTDLITGAVREFTELQGIMGSYYARHDGHPEEVAQALAEQYLPGHAGDRVPGTATGSVVSLADKLDNIASFFSIGLSPTGSEDPFALRRQTFGIIAILLNTRYPMSIPALLDKALEPFAVRDKETLMADLIKFFEQRIDSVFQSSGSTPDAIAAITRFVASDPLAAVKERLDAVQAFKTRPDYESFLLAIKRVNNIAPKSDMPPVREDLFAHDEERELRKSVAAVAPKVAAAIAKGKYAEALEALLGLRAPINTFFDKVLIMDKSEEIKQNRLGLIKSVQALAFQVADFSKLSEQ